MMLRLHVNMRWIPQAITYAPGYNCMYKPFYWNMTVSLRRYWHFEKEFSCTIMLACVWCGKCRRFLSHALLILIGGTVKHCQNKWEWNGKLDFFTYMHVMIGEFYISLLSSGVRFAIYLNMISLLVYWWRSTDSIWLKLWIYMLSSQSYLNGLN